MSLPDPLVAGTNPNLNLPKIYSPSAGQSVYRYEYPTGEVLKMTFFQNGNAKRSRHLARVDWTNSVDLKGNFNTCSVTLSIDEPASGIMPDSQIVYFWEILRDTLTDTVIHKMLNQEL